MSSMRRKTPGLGDGRAGPDRRGDRIRRDQARTRAHRHRRRFGLHRSQPPVRPGRRQVSKCSGATRRKRRRIRWTRASASSASTTSAARRSPWSSTTLVTPSCLVPTIWSIPPTFPARWRKSWRRRSGRIASASILQGAAGDINPYYDKMKLDEGAETLMRETGRQLGDEALRVAKSIAPIAPTTPEIQSLSRNAPVQTALRRRRKLLEQLRQRRVSSRIHRTLSRASRHADGLRRDDRADQSRHRDHGHARRAVRRVRPQFPRPCRRLRPRISPATATASTATSPRSAPPSKGATARKAITARVEVGAGEAMVDMAVIRLLTMQGLLKTEP